MDIKKLIRENLRRYSAYETVEQPMEDGWVKLNTNENPLPPIPEVMNNLKNAIDNLENVPRFTKPIPVVLSGGTSKAKGFKDLFVNEMNKYKFPFKVSEVRFASDQLRAVATGAMIAAVMEYE